MYTQTGIGLHKHILSLMFIDTMTHSLPYRCTTCSGFERSTHVQQLCLSVRHDRFEWSSCTEYVLWTVLEISQSLPTNGVATTMTTSSI